VHLHVHGISDGFLAHLKRLIERFNPVLVMSEWILSRRDTEVPRCSLDVPLVESRARLSTHHAPRQSCHFIRMGGQPSKSATFRNSSTFRVS
jgi:hypothetical protein